MHLTISEKNYSTEVGFKDTHLLCFNTLFTALLRLRVEFFAFYRYHLEICCKLETNVNEFELSYSMFGECFCFHYF